MAINPLKANARLIVCSPSAPKVVERRLHAGQSTIDGFVVIDNCAAVVNCGCWVPADLQRESRVLKIFCRHSVVKESTPKAVAPASAETQKRSYAINHPVRR